MTAALDVLLTFIPRRIEFAHGAHVFCSGDALFRLPWSSRRINRIALMSALYVMIAEEAASFAPYDQREKNYTALIDMRALSKKLADIAHEQGLPPPRLWTWRSPRLWVISVLYAASKAFVWQCALIEVSAVGKSRFLTDRLTVGRRLLRAALPMIPRQAARASALAARGEASVSTQRALSSEGKDLKS